MGCIFFAPHGIRAWTRTVWLASVPQVCNIKLWGSVWKCFEFEIAASTLELPRGCCLVIMPTETLFRGRIAVTFDHLQHFHQSLFRW